ncbi:MAG: hypothetical protein ACLUVD_07625 [Mediterraneibacter faecis]
MIEDDECRLEQVPKALLGDRTNMVFSGSFLTYGRGSICSYGGGMKTEVGKDCKTSETTSEKQTPLQVNLDDFGKKLSILILVFCASSVCNQCIPR